ncbi:LacI family transcriptional regulator [Eubacteriales bacterium OttesenSCG-928-N13]|nr:LacI family transcriptional regulator [Eubacteriales bacterium OttesenSCG-928-N13]
MNIYDISKKAGVSIATVSRVLNNSSRVSEKTREKVLQVMQEHEYQPNAFARGLGLNTMHTIGLLCADVADPFLAQAISHLERQLRAHGYDCLLCCTGYDRQNRERDMALLMSRRVDALIFVGSNFISQREKENQYIIRAAQQLPVMLLNGRLDGENIYCTLLDDEKASFDATQLLISRGSKRPAYLYHIPSYGSERKKAGFERALLASGIAASPDHAQLISIPSSADALDQFMQGHPDVDGVLVSDDALGVAMLKCAMRHNLRVPDDLMIVGYNNSGMASCCEPELTSVDNKLESMCTQTVSALMGVLDGQELPRTVIFSGDIIERGSTR